MNSEKYDIQWSPMKDIWTTLPSYWVPKFLSAALTGGSWIQSKLSLPRLTTPGIVYYITALHSSLDMGRTRNINLVRKPCAHRWMRLSKNLLYLGCTVVEIWDSQHPMRDLYALFFQILCFPVWKCSMNIPVDSEPRILLRFRKRQECSSQWYEVKSLWRKFV